jgi:hypothetical protein
VVTLQFVYPYTLEDFVLHPQQPHKSHHDRIAKLHEEHEVRLKFLREREEEKLRKRKEALKKVAPGYEPPDAEDTSIGGISTHNAEDGRNRKSGILEPTRKNQTPAMTVLDAPVHIADGSEGASKEKEVKPRDVMDDLVEGLARMDELESKS